MFIDLHIIQTVPLANLNRDDAGSPKTMPYGGVKRLRVSSQSWKRAARESMEAAGLAGRTYRTRHPDARLADLLTERGFDAAAAVPVARWAFSMLGTGTSKADKNVLLFASEAELGALADLLNARCGEFTSAFNAFAAQTAEGEAQEEQQATQAPAKGAKARKAAPPAGPDFATAGISEKEITAAFSLATHADAIGLFGRMLADNDKVNADAAVAVAHAFSVHAAAVEFDYFTAVEDIPDDSEGSGAAMIETTEFSSGTLYRYATIDVEELVANCGGNAQVAAALAEAFISAMALSMPSGKKNATAPHTVPAIVAVAARSDRPVSLAPAFEEAIRSTNGYESKAVEQMCRYSARASKMVAPAVAAGYVTTSERDCAVLGAEYHTIAALAAAATAASF